LPIFTDSAILPERSLLTVISSTISTQLCKKNKAVTEKSRINLARYSLINFNSYIFNDEPLKRSSWDFITEGREEWKNGRMEGWKNGRLERMEGWKNRKNGKMEERKASDF
jgi:hypothetical protein